MRELTCYYNWKRALLVSFLVVPLYLLAQVEIARDKRTIISSDNDAEVFQSFMNILEYYDNRNWDSAIHYSKAFVEFTDATQLPDYRVKARRMLSSFYDDIGFYNQALRIALEGYEITQREEVSPVRLAEIYHGLGWIYVDLREPDKVSTYFEQAIEISKSLADTVNIAYGLHGLGSYLIWDSSKVDLGVAYLREASELIQTTKTSLDTLISIQEELALGYSMLRDTSKTGELIKMLAPHYNMMSPYRKYYFDAVSAIHTYNRGAHQKGIDMLLALQEGNDEMGMAYTEEAINLCLGIINLATEQGNYKLASKVQTDLRRREIEYQRLQKINLSKEMEAQFEAQAKITQIRHQSETIKAQTWAMVIIVIVSIIAIFMAIVAWKYSLRVHQKNEKIETLMRELHHRVKNNLQVISSLLGLQSMKLEDQLAKQAVDAGQERIRAMSLIHQKLYQNDEVTKLSLKEYIENLVRELAASYGMEDRTRIKLDIPDIHLDADTTLPLGLIINELVSNAFKYAFKDIEEPVLELKFIAEENLNYLWVKDNGEGLPPDFNFEEAKSFGLRLVNTLVKQLSGSLEIKQKGGLIYNLKFAN